MTFSKILKGHTTEIYGGNLLCVKWLLRLIDRKY